MPKVLLVDDDAAVLFALGELIGGSGHEVVTAASGAEALTRLDDVDAVVTDLAMPGMDGLQLMEEIRARDPDMPVILITAHGSERIAVNALKRGAYDYIGKPFDNEEVSYSVQRALETRRLRRRSERLTLEEVSGLRIVGDSPALSRLLTMVRRVASKDVTVLVRGETGTGKELVATLLHAHSGRARGPLVKFNCAAIPHELAEAQLFGHARGAFTGASAAHDGFFVQASGGTLLLDEIGELTAAVQAKLLRVLQEREVQPLGSTRVEKVDVRVVASTHRDLLAEVRAGRFREDLYYRLAVVELVVPSLRERPEDIPVLAREFSRKYSQRFGLDAVAQLTPAFLQRLAQMAWPGNVRQLENTIARCIALASGHVIGPEALDTTSPERPTVAASSSSSSSAELAADGPSFREQTEAFERNLLSRALTASGGNQSEAARRLGLTRATLYDRLKKYGMLPEA